MLQVSVLLSVLKGMTPSYAYSAVRFPFDENCVHSIVQRWCINQKDNSCHLLCSMLLFNCLKYLHYANLLGEEIEVQRLSDLPKATHLVSSRVSQGLSDFHACALTSRFLYKSTDALLSYLFHHILHFILWSSLNLFPLHISYQYYWISLNFIFTS